MTTLPPMTRRSHDSLAWMSDEMTLTSGHAIKTTVESELGMRSPRCSARSHSRLPAQLLEAPTPQYFVSAAGGTLRLWVVMDESPATPTEGRVVVYDELNDTYGLATKPRRDAHGTFLGYYASLSETLKQF